MKKLIRVKLLHVVTPSFDVSDWIILSDLKTMNNNFPKELSSSCLNVVLLKLNSIVSLSNFGSRCRGQGMK